jgi:hypothetical protein
MPARLLYGRWAQSVRESEELGGEPYRQTHVKVEAFVRGVGWLPVDPSSAILHDPDPASERFFGRDEGDFIVLHVDPELVVDSVYWGSRTLEGLQTPAWFVRGTGTTDGAETRDDWSVEPLP